MTEPDAFSAADMSAINGAGVTPRLMWDVIQRMERLPPEDRQGMMRQGATILRLCKAMKVPGNVAMTAIVINMRLLCFTELMGLPQLDGCFQPAEADMVSVSRATVQAMAEEPVILDADGEPCFDADSLRRRVLAIEEEWRQAAARESVGAAVLPASAGRRIGRGRRGR